MFKQVHQWVAVIALGVIGLGATAPANAGMPVIDVANLTEAIEQVLSWAQQLQGMEQQYVQLQSTYKSMTGPRGMQSLLPISLANRNYLPVNYAQLASVMNGTSTAYPALSAQVQGSIQANAILSAPRGEPPVASGSDVLAATAAGRCDVEHADAAVPSQRKQSFQQRPVADRRPGLDGGYEIQRRFERTDSVRTAHDADQSDQDRCPVSKRASAAVAERAVGPRGGGQATGRTVQLDPDYLVAADGPHKRSRHDRLCGRL